MTKKTIIMLLCACMVIAGAALGTVAYLTDRESITNTFTFGHVDIAVDETAVDAAGMPVYPEGTQLGEDGKPLDPGVKPLRTAAGNAYALLPGCAYTKDPTMTVKAGSAEAYVRMIVTISGAKAIGEVFGDLKRIYPDRYADGFLPEQHVLGWNGETWPCAAMTQDEQADTIRLEFRYKQPVSGGSEDIALEPLFAGIAAPRELNGDHLGKLNGMQITVTGEAVQTAGFENENQAWAAFDAQYAAENGQP